MLRAISVCMLDIILNRGKKERNEFDRQVSRSLSNCKHSEVTLVLTFGSESVNTQQMLWSSVLFSAVASSV